MKFKQFIIPALIAAPVAAFAGQTLNGAGATFPAPIYQRWFNDYSKSFR
jgi:phosphate transport system substrate-binding protein